MLFRVWNSMEIAAGDSAVRSKPVIIFKIDIMTSYKCCTHLTKKSAATEISSSPAVIFKILSNCFLLYRVT